jgi:hypothetical protein
MYITIEKLRRRGACLSQQELFLMTFPEHEYPNGVEVTLDTCLRHSQDFEFVWAADHFLRGEARFNFFKAEEEAFQMECLDATKAYEATHPDGSASAIRVEDTLQRVHCYYSVVTAQLFFEGVTAMEKGRE